MKCFRVSSAPRHSHRDDGAGPAAAAGLAASGRLRDTRLCRRQAAGAPADSVAGRIRGVGGNPAAPYAALGRFLYPDALRRAARAEAGASRAFGGAGARFPMLFLLLDTDGVPQARRRSGRVFGRRRRTADGAGARGQQCRFEVETGLWNKSIKRHCENTDLCQGSESRKILCERANRSHRIFCFFRIFRRPLNGSAKKMSLKGVYRLAYEKATAFFEKLGQKGRAIFSRR